MEKKLTYKKAVNEIEKIISKLENEELDMDDLLVSVKKASELLNLCKNKLTKTEKEVKKILDNIETDLNDDNSSDNENEVTEEELPF
ncbi:MAG: hypothetical protein Kow0068_03160 [Marinilabiliales bacterium]